MPPERMNKSDKNTVEKKAISQLTPADPINSLSKAEAKKILYQFNNTRTDFPKGKTIADLFVAQACQMPDQTAVVYNGNICTYSELDTASNQLAHHLLDKYKIKPEDLISIQIDKSECLLISLLAVLKSGAAYVPIAPNYPEARKKYLEASAKCKISIDEPFLKSFFSHRSAYLPTRPMVSITPKNLACVIYTSGTSGLPKGVMVLNKNIIRLVKPCHFFPLNSSTVLLSTAAMSFDAINIEFWGTLLNGGKLILVDREALLDVQRFKDILRRNKVNTLWITAPWLHQLVELDVGVFNGLKQLITGGDVVSPKYIKTLLEAHPDLQIVNGYGPTENTTFSTAYRIEKITYNTIPIGKPIENSQAYILGQFGQLQPIGIAGELYVAGEGLARGYLYDEVLTAERFVENPFVKGARMYRTGDLARWLPDGNIEFLGRLDEQVKIRGYRIALEEIENALQQEEDLIRGAAVKVKVTQGEKLIVAYVIPKAGFSCERLKEKLSKRLPDYMMPSLFVEIAHIPLTPNGKVDKGSLPEAKLEAQKKSHEPPQGKIEEKLAKIWETLLHSPLIGRGENFFECGGDSLKAMALLAKIRDAFGVSLQFHEAFEFKTLTSQARLIAKNLPGKTAIRSHKLVIREEVYAPSFAQLRWLITNRIDSRGSRDNLIQTLNVPKGIQAVAIQSFVKKIVQKHDILRTGYAFTKAQWRCYISNVADVKIEIHKVYAAEITKEKFIKNIKKTYFSFDTPPLWKVFCYEGHTLVFVIHHLISDAWSLKILQDEWDMFLKPRPRSALLEECASFKAHLDWELNYKRSEAFENDKKYWLECFSKVDSGTHFPILTKGTHGVKGHFHFDLAHEVFEGLKQLVRQRGQTAFILLLAIYYKTISALLNRKALTVGIPVNGRDAARFYTMGFFPKMIMMPVQNVPDNWSEWLDLIGVQFSLALKHSNYHYHHLVKDLDMRIAGDYFPISGVFFNGVASQPHTYKAVTQPDYRLDSDKTRYDFNAYVYEFKNCISFNILINKSKVNRELAYRFHELYLYHTRCCIDAIHAA